jgi:proline-specific peptidase
MKEEEGYLAVPGGNIWYRKVGEGGVPLLVLHGGPGFCHDYLENLEDLANRRQVILFDQLGCGLSDRPDDPSLWTVDFYMDEVDAVCDAFDLREFHLFGNSWGGMLGMNYAIDRAPSIVSLTVSNSPGDMRRFVADCDGLVRELPDEIQETIRWHEAHCHTACPEYQGAIAYWYRKHVCRMRPWPDGLERSIEKAGMGPYGTMIGASEFHVTGNLLEWGITAQLPQLAVPTLFLAGEYDEIRPEHVRELHRLVPSSQYILYEGIAHMPFYEAREEFGKDMNEFFDRTEAGLPPIAIERVHQASAATRVVAALRAPSTGL